MDTSSLHVHFMHSVQRMRDAKINTQLLLKLPCKIHFRISCLYQKCQLDASGPTVAFLHKVTDVMAPAAIVKSSISKIATMCMNAKHRAMSLCQNAQKYIRKVLSIYFFIDSVWKLLNTPSFTVLRVQFIVTSLIYPNCVMWIV